MKHGNAIVRAGLLVRVFVLAVFVLTCELRAYNNLTDQVYNTETQWAVNIRSRVRLFFADDKIYWNITHVSTYGSIGSFSVLKNGNVYQTYSGTQNGQPYNQEQNGFMTFALGDEIQVLFASYALSSQSVSFTPSSVTLQVFETKEFIPAGGHTRLVWSDPISGQVETDIGQSLERYWGNPHEDLELKLWAKSGVGPYPPGQDKGIGYAKSDEFIGHVVVTANEHTVTISPTEVKAVVGQTTTFRAEGSHTGYIFSLSGGGLLTYSGASAVVKWTKPGHWLLKVWGPAGGGWPKSNEATAIIDVEGEEASPHKVTLTFDNTARNYAVTFRVWQKGKVITTRTVPGGKVLIQTITVPTADPVTVTAILKDGETDLFSDGVEEVVGEATPTDTTTGNEPPNTDATPEDPEEGEEGETPPGVTPQDNQDAQQAVASALIAAEKGKEQANKAVANLGLSVDVTKPTEQAADSGVIDLGTIGGRQLVIHKNPFDEEGPFGGVMRTAAAFVKRLIAWGLVIAFSIWCMGEVTKMIQAPFKTSSFGDSLSANINSIKLGGVGGGIGYAVRLVVFAGTLVVMLTLPVAVSAAVSTGLPWSEIRSVVSAGPTAGAPSGRLGDAVGLTSYVIPWGVLMVVPAWYLTVRMILFPSYFFWMMFVKFLPI